MAYDEKLAARVRVAVKGKRGISEKEMFGGIAFLKDTKMFIGISGSDLMVRVGPDAHEDALAKAHVRPMKLTGRPMKGYVYVAPDGCRTASTLKAWVDQGAAFVATVEKKPKPAKKAAAKTKAKTKTKTKTKPKAKAKTKAKKR